MPNRLLKQTVTMQMSDNGFRNLHLRLKAYCHHRIRDVVKNLDSAIQRLVKRLFFAFESFASRAVASRANLGKDIAHRAGEHVDQLVEEGS